MKPLNNKMFTFQNWYTHNHIFLVYIKVFTMKIFLKQEYHCFVEMISICDVMQVPAENDREHWPVNKFQHILAHFSDQVRYY